MPPQNDALKSILKITGLKVSNCVEKHYQNIIRIIL
jgi:hypothetical protein